MSIFTDPGDTCRVPRSAPPPQAYFLGSAVFHYLGPSFAVLLFARLDVLGVAWLRIASAAVVFAAWRRPWRTLRLLDRDGLILVISLGAVFAAMNASFYVAIDRLPLAMVAAIEFLGPIGLALTGARSARNVSAVAAAAIGVFLLTHVRLAGEPVGIAFAFVNAALFTIYIALAHRLARRAVGSVDGLAVAMIAAFAFIAPVGVAQAWRAVGDPIDVASASPADQLEATQRLADALEATIAAVPSQWYSFKPIWPSDPAEGSTLERRAAAMALDHGAAPREAVAAATPA